MNIDTERRALLRAAAAIAVAESLAVPASAVTDSDSGPSRADQADSTTRRAADRAATDADVVVVGAGAAGIRAASILARSGLRVVVLEARQRIGGRIHTIRTMDGHAIELGAQFLAANGRQRRLQALAAKHAFSRQELPTAGRLVQLHGGARRELAADDSGIPILASLDLLRLDGAINRRLKAFRRDPFASATALNNVSVAAWLEKAAWSSDARLVLHTLFEQAVCVELGRVSMQEALDTLDALGGTEALGDLDRYYFPGGLEELFKREAVASQLDIRLGARVVAIRADGGTQRVQMHGGEVRAHRVVVAIPPQLYANIDFEPKLPAGRRAVFERFLTGRVAKVIAVYPHPWWRELGFSGLVSSATAAIDVVYDTSPPGDGAGVLVGLVAGPRADLLLDTDRSGMRRTMRAHVTRSFGRDYPISELHFLDWTREPYSAGAYASRRALGDWMPNSTLFSPENGVHFAGSETADEWRGTIEGALQSADRAAARVLDSLRDA